MVWEGSSGRNPLPPIPIGPRLCEGGALATCIALIGLSGAGKSSVAPLLATRLGLDSIDLDEAVVRRAGKTISEIILTQGEGAFRSLETLELRAALEGGGAGQGCVIACGGGILGGPENQSLLDAKSFVVWLRVSPLAAARRLEEAGTASRPLLAGRPPLETIRDMWLTRRSLYERAADAAVDTDGRTPGDVVEAIVALDTGGNAWGSFES